MTQPNWPTCLGDTVDEIVSSLRQLKILGRQRSPRACPLAASYVKFHDRYDTVLVFVAAHLDDGVKHDMPASNITERIVIEINDKYLSGIPLVNQMALAQFAKRFDFGEFSDLRLTDEQEEKEEKTSEEGGSSAVGEGPAHA